MKKLNKKGSSLIELVISIALMSVILVSMVRLLVDLNNTNTNNVYAKNNQINRTEIIRTIENDLNDNNNILTNVEDNGSTADTLKIKFTFNNKTNKTSTLAATKNKYTSKSTITYTSSSGKKRIWTMNDCDIYPNKANVQFVKDDALDGIYTLQIDIEIHTKNEKNTEGNNNLLDDILIGYYGKVADINNKTFSDCLGYSC